MVRFNIYRVLAFTVLIPMLAGAQTDNSSTLRVNDYLRSGSGYGLGLQPFGFLDASRMTFNHSYSMSYLASGNQGVMRGLFMETIGYRISNPLSLTVNLGYMHQPYSSLGPDGLTQEGSFVGGAALTWRPAKNMFLHLEVANYPQYNYNPYWNPFPYNVPPAENNPELNSGQNSTGE